MNDGHSASTETSFSGMDPEALGREYDKKASHWQEPFLQANGLAQFEKAIRFTKNRGPALDIGCGSSGRFIDLLRDHGFVPEGLTRCLETDDCLSQKQKPSRRFTFYRAPISPNGASRRNTISSRPGIASGICRWHYRNLFYKRFVTGLRTMELLSSPRAG